MESHVSANRTGIHNPGYELKQCWAGLFAAVGMGAPLDPILCHRDTHLPWDPVPALLRGILDPWGISLGLNPAPATAEGPWAAWLWMPMGAGSWDLGAGRCEQCQLQPAIPLMDNRSLRAGERHPVQTHQA